MKQKILIYSSIVFATLLVFCCGVAFALFVFTGLEFNDRLKYEAAYLRGYIGVQKTLKAGDYEKAQVVLDGLIDAHVMTLSEFRMFESLSVTYDIDKTLCKAVRLRKEHPRKTSPDHHSQELQEFYDGIDKYLVSIGKEC